MITFRRLEVRNFLSFGNILEELDLTFDGTTLIVGENVDADSKNGAGKTTILNAIVYALYNKPIAQISKERLINRTNASKTTLMEVRLEFEVNGNVYEIYRSRGESYSITLTENGKDITPDSIANTDKKIVDLIGISYELFCIAVVFSGPDQPFLSLPVAAQRALMEELTKTTELSTKAIKLKEIISGIQSEIKIQEALIKAQEVSAEQHAKRTEDAENRVIKWESDRETNIGPLEEKIDALKQVDFKGQHELFNQLQETQKEISKLSVELRSVEKDLNRRNLEHAKMHEQIKHLREAKCPFCLQAFEDSGKKLEELQEAFATELIALNASEHSFQKRGKELDELKTKESFIKQGLTYSSLTDLLRDQNSIMSLEEKLNDLKNGTNPYIEPLEKLLLEDIKEPNYDQLDNLKSNLEHHQFLLKLLTDKNSFIRKRIIGKTIPFLNTQINEYTTKLGLPHQVKFDPDMSCSVQEYGRELDFGNLSSGEKKRVNLAMSMAFRDVLHRLHSKVNILLMDEVDTGLDATGVEQAFSVIKQKARQENMGIWIISHRPEAEGRFNREIIIRKENGFSTIVL